MSSIEAEFNKLDADGSGFIEAKELCSLLIAAGYDEKVSEECSKDLVKKIDQDGDKKISLQEIKDCMKEK